MLCDYKLTTAKLNAVPTWNVSLNGSEPCSLHLDYHTDKNVTVFTGNQFQMCSVELISSKGATVMIDIPMQSSVNSFIYAERQGVLTDQNRYVVIEGDGPCVSQLFHPKLQLFLQGNISILISKISTNDFLSMPSERLDQASNESNMSEVSQIKRSIVLCPISEFNQTFSCMANSVHVCSFDFPINCNATLRTKSVEFKCPSDSFVPSYKALVDYPADIHELDLTNHRIIQISGRPFHRFETLTTIRLDYNILFTLPIGLFKGLNSLLDLRLQSNQIISLHGNLFNQTSELLFLSLGNNSLTGLPNILFKGLTNLETLHLHQNKLESLPLGLFEDLMNLTTLYLYHNKLQDLPARLFKELTNLRDLGLLSNQIISLNDRLFNETSKLEFLSLSNNSLTSLPNRLFKGLTNLEILFLSNLTNLKALPKELFRGLKSLKQLYFYDNYLQLLHNTPFQDLTDLTVLDLGRNQ